jgi:CheY-like chemotaxis protein
MSGPPSRRILVVDDQPLLTKAIRRMLSAHDVTVAASATEALAKIEAGARYDLIITDLMMPGMTGMDLHAAIERAAPEQTSRMVFMTGGAFTPEARDFFDQAGVRAIEKPFDRAGLLAVIEPLLS